MYDGLSGKAKDYADEQLFFIFTEKREWIQAYDAFLQKACRNIGRTVKQLYQTRLTEYENP